MKEKDYIEMKRPDDVIVLVPKKDVLCRIQNKWRTRDLNSNQERMEKITEELNSEMKKLYFRQHYDENTDLYYRYKFRAVVYDVYLNKFVTSFKIQLGEKETITKDILSKDLDVMKDKISKIFEKFKDLYPEYAFELVLDEYKGYSKSREQLICIS